MSDFEFTEHLEKGRPCAECLLIERNLCNGVITKIVNSKIEKAICDKVRKQQNNSTLQTRLKDSLIPDKFINGPNIVTKSYIESYYETKDLRETTDILAWVISKIREDGATGVVLTKPWLDYRGISYVDTPLIQRTISKDYVVVIYPSQVLTPQHMAMIKTRKSSIIGRPIQTFVIGE